MKGLKIRALEPDKKNLGSRVNTPSRSRLHHPSYTTHQLLKIASLLFCICEIKKFFK
jgi:hypothetical protein